MSSLKHKRWQVLAASISINFCLGTYYAWSIFAAGYMDLFQWPADKLTIVFILSALLGPVSMTIGGKMMDKYGVRVVILLASILYSAGNFFCGVIESLAVLYVVYPATVTLGMSTVFNCTVNNSIKFFPEHRGLVSGVVTTSIGGATIFIAPLVQMLIHIFHVQMTFRIIGIASMVIMIAASLFIRQAPEQEGLSVPHRKVRSVDKNWKEMLKTPLFYALVLMFLAGATAGMMIASQLAIMAQGIVKVTAAAAAVAVSVFSFMNAAGRVTYGILADRIGWRNVLIIMFLAILAGEALLITSGYGTWIRFLIGISMVGICYGGFIGIYPAITAENFGTKNQGTNYGIMFWGFAIGGLVGPQLTVSLGNVGSNPYIGGFIAAFVIAAIGLVISLFVKRQKA
ncbi:OFA family MFS transporter [Zhenpiania hominis]|uniref:OFA family MFS transporter n=1 Tax=Zhenpiania hominis TaxID=2763644 RepID=A0A923NQA5_9FIRM|nr:OFA family MFS transporter [Zhenpiania hominis]MBC6680720.1 OFA family MFS transporter [Zhenpiania hominis]